MDKFHSLTLTDDLVVERSHINKIPSKEGIYRIYDCHNRLLYIGKSTDLKRRVNEHFNSYTNTWKFKHLFKKVICSFVPTHLEKKFIEELKPLLNAEYSVSGHGLFKYEWDEIGWKYICENLNLTFEQYEKYRANKFNSLSIPFSIVRNKEENEWGIQEMKDFVLPNIEKLSDYIELDKVKFSDNSIKIANKKEFRNIFMNAFSRYCEKEKIKIEEKIKKNEILYESMWLVYEVFSQDEKFNEFWKDDYYQSIKLKLEAINELVYQYDRLTNLEGCVRKMYKQFVGEN